MIGSHNSMSYLPVRQWYLKPFGWMARCQSKTLNEQLYIYGVRLFDVRIRFDKNGNPIYAHGPIKFGHVGLELYYLNNWAKEVDEPVYVRLILESNKPMKDQHRQELLFQNICRHWSTSFNRITFFGGNRKYDWKEIYHFDTDVQLKDLYSSTTNIFGGSKDHWTAKLDDLWPWLYAKLRNKKNIRNHKDDDGILFIDYVNIR